MKGQKVGGAPIFSRTCYCKHDEKIIIKETSADCNPSILPLTFIWMTQSTWDKNHDTTYSFHLSSNVSLPELRSSD